MSASCLDIDLRHERERKKLSAKQLEENARWVEQEIIELNLRALRELTGKTQVQVAKGADMTQPETSRAERREDHLIVRRAVVGPDDCGRRRRSSFRRRSTNSLGAMPP